MLQAPGQRAKGAGHRAGINHRHHLQAKALRQIGGARLAVKQPHHAFDNDQVGVLRGIVQTLRAVRLAGHPQIELVYLRTAGQRQPVRVQKIRPALEDAHLPALPRMQARQGARHRGLALAGGRGGDEDGGAAGHAYFGAHFTPA